MATKRWTSAGYYSADSNKSSTLPIIQLVARSLANDPRLVKAWDNFHRSKPRVSLPPAQAPWKSSLINDIPRDQQVDDVDPQASDDVARLSRVLSRFSSMSLQGLDQGCQRPSQFYLPLIRMSQNTHGSWLSNKLGCPQDPQIVEPIGTLTMWRGLTLNDCQTLIFIQGYLKVCLERLLEDQFASFRARLLGEWQSKYYKTCAENEDMKIHLRHRFYFQRSRLIDAMSEALDVSMGMDKSVIDVVGRELLMLYLWSRDCLVDLPFDDSKHTAIDVDFRCSLQPTAILPPMTAVEAAWIPDYLSFETLSILPHEGDDIIIKPHYCPNVRRAPDGPYMQVTFSLDPKHSWLNWDARTGAFRGQIPNSSRYLAPHDIISQDCPVGAQASLSSVHLYRIEVKAFVVVSYPGSKVRLERTTRARITLRVRPAALNLAPLSSHESPKPCRNIALLDNTRHSEVSQARAEDLEAAGIRIREDSRGPFETRPLPMTNHEAALASVSPTAATVSAPKSELKFRKTMPSKRHALPFRIKETPHEQAFSNIPGISLAKIASPDQTHLEDHPAPVIIKDPSEDSARYSLTADIGDEEAANLEREHGPSYEKRRNASRWLDAALCPNSSKQRKQRSPISTSQPLQVCSLQVSSCHNSCIEDFSAQKNAMTSLEDLQHSSGIVQPDHTGAIPFSLKFYAPTAPPRDMRRSSSSDTMVDAIDSDIPSWRAGSYYSKTPYELPSPKNQPDDIVQNFRRCHVPIKDCAEGLEDHRETLIRMPPTRNERKDSGTGLFTPAPTENGSDVASVPLPPSPDKINDDYNEGLSPSDQRDLNALLKLVGIGQAPAVFRDPALSMEEKSQMLEAMKRSVESRPDSRVCSGSMGANDHNATPWLESTVDEGSDGEDMSWGEDL
ncbi:MAG: hypothetical protein Q9222_000379 [Ikaeria aurantiellina]